MAKKNAGYAIFLLLFLFVIFSMIVCTAKGREEEKKYAEEKSNKIVKKSLKGLNNNKNNNNNNNHNNNTNNNNNHNNNTNKNNNNNNINNNDFLNQPLLHTDNFSTSFLSSPPPVSSPSPPFSPTSSPLFLPPSFPSNLQISSVDPGTAARFPIPLAVEGECHAGEEFTIKSVDDLFKNIQNLECIFAAGVSPDEEDQVPLGFSYGYLLSFINIGFWNRIANIAYQGDYVLRTQCNGTLHNIGWMSIGGFKLGTALWTIGDFPYKIPQEVNGGGEDSSFGEYPLGKSGGILMDFRLNFRKICPLEGDESKCWRYGGFNPFSKSIWPINQFVDMGRVVGRDESDGGLIILNKAFLITEDKGPITVLIYATKNFDVRVMPHFAVETPAVLKVPPGEKNEKIIKYNRKGLIGVVENLLPIHKLYDVFKENILQNNRQMNNLTDMQFVI